MHTITQWERYTPTSLRHGQHIALLDGQPCRGSAQRSEGGSQINKSFIPPDHSQLISRWEHRVAFNLSETGAPPISIEAIDESSTTLGELRCTPLGYPPTNGSALLRERIASLYRNATAENVLVTAGGAQANFATALTVLSPGDEIVMLSPTYRQLWTISKNFGFNVRTAPRMEKKGWDIDLDRLESLVTHRTKLIYVCNPNNPTGHVLSAVEQESLISMAERVGAWLMSDEVCIGMERIGNEETQSLWGSYENIIVTNSLSKAYGLAGTRIGWVVGTTELVREVWARQDLITISANMLGTMLGSCVLSPETRSRILTRTRGCVKDGYRILEHWISMNADLFSLSPPRAGGSVFLCYHRNIPSIALVDRLIREYGTLLVPGAYFGSEGYLRVGFLTEPEILIGGLERLAQCISEWYH